MKNICSVFVLFLFAGGLRNDSKSTLVAAEEVSVPRWQPHDFSFTADAVVANPFTAEFSAVVTGLSVGQPR